MKTYIDKHCKAITNSFFKPLTGSPKPHFCPSSPCPICDQIQIEKCKNGCVCECHVYDAFEELEESKEIKKALKKLRGLI